MILGKGEIVKNFPRSLKNFWKQGRESETERTPHYHRWVDAFGKFKDPSLHILQRLSFFNGACRT